MFYLIKPGSKIDFVKSKNIWIVMSVVMILATFVLLFTKGLNYGIDFTGGAELHIKLPQEWATEKVRSTLEKGGIQDSKIVRIADPGKNEFLIRVQGDEKSLNQVSEKVTSVLAGAIESEAQKKEFEVLRSDVVGPAAGSMLRVRGFLAMFYALLVILIYVAVRFDSRYAPGAVLALFHDSVICIGIFILTQKQFDLTILAAILALIGYSNNDTIIVYDRVRETTHNHPELSMSEAVNRAINETLGRTLMTSLTTFIVVASLWFFGGSVIGNFAFTLMVGIVVGTYSSIFIASPVIIMMSDYQKRRTFNRPVKKSRSSEKSVTA